MPSHLSMLHTGQVSAGVNLQKAAALRVAAYSGAAKAIQSDATHKQRLLVAGFTVGAAVARRPRCQQRATSEIPSDPSSYADSKPSAMQTASSDETPKASSSAEAENIVEVDIVPPSEANSEAELKNNNPVPFASPIGQTQLSLPSTSGVACEKEGLFFPRQSGGYLDLTIGAAKPLDEQGASASSQAESEGEEKSLLKNLPFVETTDAIAESLGLPNSREVEAFGRELLKEPQRLLKNRLQPASTSTFQSPVVSFVYERGWRSSFASSGFPGPDEEFRLAQEFLHEGEGLLGDVLLDASCGSGLFSRRFASSGDYSTVVALDYSEAMLRQVDALAKKELGAGYATAAPGKTSLQLVRADIARLPFATNSLGGVHAGAAIHCWPNPENAVAEVSRVLRPGGVFVLTTFMPRGPMASLGRNNTPYRFWSEEELSTLTRKCGLVDFKAVTKDPAFIMVRVRKPKV